MQLNARFLDTIFSQGTRLRILAMLALISWTQLARGQDLCQDIFHKVFAQKQIVGAAVAHDAAVEVSGLTPLLRADSKLTSEIKHVTETIEFIDYAHFSETFLKRHLSPTHDISLEPANISKRYDFYDNAYTQFQNARTYLNANKPELGPEILLKVHQLAMSGVARIANNEAGAFRNRAVIGRVTEQRPISLRQIENIKQNPYLDFVVEGEVSATVQQTHQLPEIWGVSPKNTFDDQPKYFGRIIYPSIDSATPEMIAIVNRTFPDFGARIIALRDRAQGIRPNEVTSHLTLQLVQGLTNELIQKFNDQVSELGVIDTSEKRQLYISYVAEFQRNFISVHPFMDGNGRTSRLIMNYLLNRVGLASAVLVDPNEDIFETPAYWQQSILRAINNSQRMSSEISRRVELDLDYTRTPLLVFPGLPTSLTIETKAMGGRVLSDRRAIAKVDQDQFLAFISAMGPKAVPQILAANDATILKTMSDLAELFVEYYRSKTIRFIHNKDGEREISLRLVDLDFRDKFAVLEAADPTRWSAKMDRWYDKSMLLWRGIANRNHEYSDDELIKYFTTLQPHLMSNRVLRETRGGIGLREAILSDFSIFNSEMIDGKLVEMAMDHHRVGPRYGESYGYSTSKREIVGKAFAMGAMVIGEYGKHRDPELQKNLKSRINVAFYKANKDVDLGRLRLFDPNFSYKYGRQAEVMGIGGADPDSVVLVQRIDESGNVVSTLYRNPENPAEILIIDGRYVPGDQPLEQARIKSRVTLEIPKNTSARGHEVSPGLSQTTKKVSTWQKFKNLFH